MERTVIRNAAVLSMDPAVGEHLDADVLIEGEKIAAVRPNIGPVDGREIDGRDMIVLPGFVDTHRHTWQSALRNTATDWSLAQYFGGVRGIMGELYTPDDMYVANHIGALEALAAKSNGDGERYVTLARFFAENITVQAASLERTVIDSAEAVNGADAVLLA